MPNDLTFSMSTLYSFLLVLARIASAMIFVPIPGMKNTPDVPKIVFSVCVTFALLPSWPAPPDANPGMGLLTAWLLSEAAFGLTVGLAVAFLAESFVFAAQILGLQAGYSYASTIDPTNQTDIGVLQVLAQLMAGFLFFGFGLDREIIRIFAHSLEVYPPGAFQINEPMVIAVQRLGSVMFSTGLKLAMPVMALLMLFDLSLALLGRINAQLQLLTLAFPVKMLGALAALAAMAALLPSVFEKNARQTVSMLTSLFP
ncbi:MAG: flagellar biosynthetic protein FliR [Bryobacteraceae bacterium]